MQILEVDFFDGVSSQKQSLILHVKQGWVHFPQKNWQFSFEDIKISSKIPNTPQTITLPNGGYCLTKKEENIKIKSSVMFNVEKKSFFVILSIIFMIGFIVFTLTKGGDIAGKIVAKTLPQSVSQTIGTKSFDFLKEHYLAPSNLPATTKTYLKKELKKLTPNNLHVKLHFYKSKKFKANAFALPSNDIILLDDLVLKDKNPKKLGIIGVLAHEIGHIQKHHTIQQITKTSIAGMLSAYFIGDFSSMLTTVTTGLISLSYSREFEKEADEIAVKLLKKQGYSLKPLANLFKSLNTSSNQNSILSSHPLTQERIEFFLSND